MKILVTTFDRPKRRAIGITLARERALGYIPGEHTLWCFASGWSRVVCTLPKLESIGSGMDSQGLPVTFLNGNGVQRDADLIVDPLRFIIDRDIEQSAPFFLLSECGDPPAVFISRVRLLFSRLSDVPDAKAESNLLRDIDIDWDKELPEFPLVEKPASISVAWMSKAEATAPRSGQWLPFEIGTVQGAMQLGESRGDAIFDAVLHIERSAPAIKPGALLRRSVTWTLFDGEAGSAEADIATVLDLG